MRYVFFLNLFMALCDTKVYVLSLYNFVSELSCCPDVVCFVISWRSLLDLTRFFKHKYLYIPPLENSL